MIEFPNVHGYANGRCRHCGEYRAEGLTSRKICSKCAEFPEDVLATMSAMDFADGGDFDATEENAARLLEGLRQVGFTVAPIDADADAAASDARQSFKAMEQQWMVLQDQYSELARTIGVEGDAFWGDPLVDHAGVMAKSKMVMQVLAAYQEYVAASVRSVTTDRVKPVKLLEDACAAAGSQTAWAKANGISLPYVNDVLQGRREPGDKILAALGCRKVVYFVKGAAA